MTEAGFFLNTSRFAMLDTILTKRAGAGVFFRQSLKLNVKRLFYITQKGLLEQLMVYIVIQYCDEIQIFLMGLVLIIILGQLFPDKKL
jgi:hypothetical protein